MEAANGCQELVLRAGSQVVLRENCQVGGLDLVPSEMEPLQGLVDKIQGLFGTLISLKVQLEELQLSGSIQENQIRELQADDKETKAQNEKLKGRIETLETENTVLKENIERLEQKMVEAGRKLEEHLKNLKKHEQTSTIFKEKLDILKKNEKELKIALKQLKEKSECGLGKDLLFLGRAVNGLLDDLQKDVEKKIYNTSALELVYKVSSSHLFFDVFTRCIFPENTLAHRIYMLSLTSFAIYNEFSKPRHGLGRFFHKLFSSD